MQVQIQVLDIVAEASILAADKQKQVPFFRNEIGQGRNDKHSDTQGKNIDYKIEPKQ